MAKNWKRAAGILWPVLVKAAKNKATLEYGEDIAPILGYDPKKGGRVVRFALGPIQDFCVERELPRLTVLVVSRKGKHGAGFLGGSIDDVYKFDWDSIPNPFTTVTLEQFVNFAPLLDGLVLKTLTRSRPFRVDVDDKCISFTPQISGGARKLSFSRDIKEYLNFYNKSCRKPANYTGSFRNSSYFLAVMMEYEKPQNEILFAKSESIDVAADNKATTKKSLLDARIGQGKFRLQLLTYWENSCSVTKVGNKQLLRASHIKPWKDADNRERLDKYNGLLLSPDLDALFDCGLITFDDNREMKISPMIEKSELKKLGVDDKMRLRQIEDKHKAYLKYHRDHIFQGEVE